MARGRSPAAGYRLGGDSWGHDRYDAHRRRQSSSWGLKVVLLFIVVLALLPHFSWVSSFLWLQSAVNFFLLDDAIHDDPPAFIEIERNLNFYSNAAIAVFPSSSLLQPEDLEHRLSRWTSSVLGFTDDVEYACQMTLRNPQENSYVLSASLVPFYADRLVSNFSALADGGASLLTAGGRSTTAELDLNIPSNRVQSASSLTIRGHFSLRGIPKDHALVINIANRNRVTGSQLSAQVQVSIQAPLYSRLLSFVPAFVMPVLPWLRTLDQNPVVRFLVVSDTCRSRSLVAWVKRNVLLNRNNDLLANLVDDIRMMVEGGHRVVLAVLGANVLFFIFSVGKVDFGFPTSRFRLDQVDFGAARGKTGLKRAFTALFAHADIFHLLFNMASLGVIGPMIHMTVACNNALFLLIYFASGLGGHLAFYLFSSENRTCVGASGALYGLDLALTVLSPIQNIFGYSVQEYVLSRVLVQAALDMLISRRIAVSAHLGGAATGYCMARLLQATVL